MRLTGAKNERQVNDCEPHTHTQTCSNLISPKRHGVDTDIRQADSRHMNHGEAYGLSLLLISTLSFTLARSHLRSVSRSPVSACAHTRTPREKHDGEPPVTIKSREERTYLPS